MESWKRYSCHQIKLKNWNSNQQLEKTASSVPAAVDNSLKIEGLVTEIQFDLEKTILNDK